MWIADYVLVTYGTGAIMAVPGQDERDWEFAEDFGLPIVRTVQPPDGFEGKAYTGPGPAINSGFLDGLEIADAMRATIDWLEETSNGAGAIQYRLRDWLISRQRYWGSPIPVVYRQDGTIEVIPDDQLPVLLPEDVDFKPTGQSPLTYHEPFLETTDSQGDPARRETDTMDTFLGSSWYHYRYLSPHYDAGPWDPDEAAYWLPVDTYTGGAEHAVMHLLYTRFFTKALRDLGVFEDSEAAMRAHQRDPAGVFDEPMAMYRSQGQILGEERHGDVVVVQGDVEGRRVVASAVEVVENGTSAEGLVVGEVVRRTENVLQVAPIDGGEQVTVEVPDSATVSIPGVPGENDVAQLRHHLEVQRMSKSKGNVVNPDELTEAYGADTVRTYLMFAFEWEKGGPWDGRGIKGAHRFIIDVWRLGRSEYTPGTVDDAATASLRRQAHKAIDKVGRDLEDFRWNTAVAELMKLRNGINDARAAGNVSSEAHREAVEHLITMLAPIAPHVTEEVWHLLGGQGSIHEQAWPVFDPEIAKDDSITMVVQVNGKVRGTVEVDSEISEEDAVAAAMAISNVAFHIEGKEVRRLIARQPKLVNIVV